MAEAREVLVVGEAAEGHLSPATGELLAVGRQVADALGGPLAAGLAYANPDRAASDAISLGADKVYTVDNPLLAEYQVDLQLAALEGLCRQTSPEVVLLSRTTAGRELAPRLAARLKVGLAQDCLEVSVDTQSGRLLANRPVYGGSAEVSPSADDVDVPVDCGTLDRAGGILDSEIAVDGRGLTLDAGWHLDLVVDAPATVVREFRRDGNVLAVLLDLDLHLLQYLTGRSACVRFGGFGCDDTDALLAPALDRDFTVHVADFHGFGPVKRDRMFEPLRFGHIGEHIGGKTDEETHGENRCLLHVANLRISG